jgi:hypothetical protein
VPHAFFLAQHGLVQLAPHAFFLAQHGLVQLAPHAFFLAQHGLVQLAPHAFFLAQHGLVQLAPHAFLLALHAFLLALHLADWDLASQPFKPATNIIATTQIEKPTNIFLIISNPFKIILFIVELIYV